MLTKKLWIFMRIYKSFDPSFSPICYYSFIFSLLQISIGLSVFGFIANEYKQIAIRLLLTIQNIRSAIPWGIMKVILNYLPLPSFIYEQENKSFITLIADDPAQPGRSRRGRHHSVRRHQGGPHFREDRLLLRVPRCQCHTLFFHRHRHCNWHCGKVSKECLPWLVFSGKLYICDYQIWSSTVCTFLHWKWCWNIPCALYMEGSWERV